MNKPGIITKLEQGQIALRNVRWGFDHNHRVQPQFDAMGVGIIMNSRAADGWHIEFRGPRGVTHRYVAEFAPVADLENALLEGIAEVEGPRELTPEERDASDVIEGFVRAARNTDATLGDMYDRVTDGGLRVGPVAHACRIVRDALEDVPNIRGV